MMIKRLSASFGKLQGKTLMLEEGLNIIEAPNESGKSTWCAFIKAMLYGLCTSDRDKLGYLSDKTHYRPWNGAAMEGSMDIVAHGKSVTLERLSEGRLPMKRFTARYTGTGEPIETLYPDTAGETLTGVSEAVFERSAYISQAGVRITQTPELEKRISSLVTTGDESSSFTEVDEQLRAWQRKRRFKQSGAIPALEESLASINHKLERIEDAQEDAAALRLEVDRLRKKKTELSEMLKAIERYEARETIRRARADYERARVRYENAYRELTKNGEMPSDDKISVVRGELRAIESLKSVQSAEESVLSDAREKLARIQSLKLTSPFSGRDAAREVDKADALTARVSELSPRSAPTVILIILAVLLAVTTVVSALQDLLPWAFIPPAAGAAMLFCIGTLVWRSVQRRRAANELKSLLVVYGVTSAEALQALYDKDFRLSSEIAMAESNVRAAEKSAASAAANVTTVSDRLVDKLSALSVTPDLPHLDAELRRLENLLGILSKAKADLRAVESVLASMKNPGDETGSTSDEPPAHTRDELTSALDNVDTQLEAQLNRYNMALGEIRALGDPVILGSEKKMAEEKLDTLRGEYAALTLAIDTLKEASIEMQSRFSPLLSETAGRIIRRLTAERYQKILFDKTLDASAKTAGDTVMRGILSLSAGTADQIYLALRLAVCELVLPADNTCPIILDDTLSNFDDHRAQAALEYLLELSQKHQILLFTCHSREAACLSGRDGVHTIALP